MSNMYRLRLHPESLLKPVEFNCLLIYQGEQEGKLKQEDEMAIYAKAKKVKNTGLDSKVRPYRTKMVAVTVPDWNVVNFPNGRRVIYPTLAKANNGRILARAWSNLYAMHDEWGKKKPTWTDIANYVGVAKKPPYRITGIDYAGSGYYQLVINGSLPKDETKKQAIFDLAGYPWE